MNFRRSRKEAVDINLTPLIDVVFLLLIFFMVSTTFTKETHLQVDLPEAASGASDEAVREVEILIDQAGQYAVNGVPVPRGGVAPLKEVVVQVAGDDRELPLVITADRNSPHHAVVTAMDAVGQLGFDRLRITTREPQ